MESKIRKSLMHLLSEKLKRVGIADNELSDRLDLVKSGLLNSLEFVDLVASLERQYQCEIDFESAFEKGNFTTLGGMIETFDSTING